MSLSKRKSDYDTGCKVVMGFGGDGPCERPLASFKQAKKASLFDCGGEAEEYLERVRAKAREKVCAMLEEANAEAEGIKAQAVEEGLAEGRAAADAQYHAFLEEQVARLTGILSGIEQQSSAMWLEHREDIAALVRITVEKVLKITLDERRSEILAQLLDQALEKLDSQRNITVRVNGEDAEVMEELLTAAKNSGNELGRWKILPDAQVSPGSVVVESEQGMVDNSIESRFEAVESIFDRLLGEVEAS
jgi:flagellar assembly protein FliH